VKTHNLLLYYCVTFELGAESFYRLEKLRRELEENDRSVTPIVEIQALPYLTAIIKEAMRLSMANPGRLLRTVPSGGWTFKSTHFPPGTDVGCSAYQLHLDPIVFPDPEAFIPERWLEEDARVKERMNKNWFVFGAGSRACIARNLAMTEMYMATERVVKSRVLEGAKACQEKVEIYEWFNSSVKGEKIELLWQEH
jgi:cytochrome P450